MLPQLDRDIDHCELLWAQIAIQRYTIYWPRTSEGVQSIQRYIAREFSVVLDILFSVVLEDWQHHPEERVTFPPLVEESPGDEESPRGEVDDDGTSSSCSSNDGP